MNVRNVCVYCGSSPGADPDFVTAARHFGRILAENRVNLVYGGGANGLMGAVADAVASHGGTVTGVIPEFLRSRENMFRAAHEMIVTADMHERKRIMFERADAFVALPGGIGTLEELVEQMTWAQLGQHKKPILLANLKGYWNGLVAVLDHMRETGFINARARLEYLACDRIEDVLPKLRAAASVVSEPDRKGDPAMVERL
jgi:uncharacterized protein (TIGR00730 family)